MEDLWGSVADGWRHLRERMSGALTRFKRQGSALTTTEDDDLGLASSSWALLFGDVYENERESVVRLEVPGLEKEDFHIQVSDDTRSSRVKNASSARRGKVVTGSCNAPMEAFNGPLRCPAP
jgi:HSP20 family molecular chaperone IbpA